MFSLLRSVIRVTSLLLFLLSFLLFLNYLRGWILIVPPLAEAALVQIDLTKQEGERLKQVRAEIQATGQPESDNSLLRRIDYQLGSVDNKATAIREAVQLLGSLIAFVLSSMLVLTAWRPDPIPLDKT